MGILGGWGLCEGPTQLRASPGVARSKTEGKPRRETDGKAQQRKKPGAWVTQPEWRGMLRLLDGSK